MQKKKGQYSFPKCKILRPSISTHIQEKLMSFPYLLRSMAIIIILMRKIINIIYLNPHLKRLIQSIIGASQVERVVKNLPATAGDIRDTGLMPGSRRSPGEGHGNLLQYSCLENSMDKRSLEGYSPWGRRVGHD